MFSWLASKAGICACRLDADSAGSGRAGVGRGGEKKKKTPSGGVGAGRRGKRGERSEGAKGAMRPNNDASEAKAAAAKPRLRPAAHSKWPKGSSVVFLMDLSTKFDWAFSIPGSDSSLPKTKWEKSSMSMKNARRT